MATKKEIVTIKNEVVNEKVNEIKKQVEKLEKDIQTTKIESIKTSLISWQNGLKQAIEILES